MSESKVLEGGSEVRASLCQLQSQAYVFGSWSHHVLTVGALDSSNLCWWLSFLIYKLEIIIISTS